MPTTDWVIKNGKRSYLFRYDLLGQYRLWAHLLGSTVMTDCSAMVFVRVLWLFIFAKNGQLPVSAFRGQRPGGCRGTSLHLDKCSYLACIRT